MSVSANGSRPAPVARRLDLRQTIRAHLGWIVGAPLALLVLTVLFVLVVRPVYEASATLRIDEDKSPVAMLQMLSALSSGSELATEMAVLGSRSVAEDVVRSLSLQVGLEAPARTRRSEVLLDLEVDTAAPAAVYTLEPSGGGYRLRATITRAVDQPRPFQRPRTETRDFGVVRAGGVAVGEGVRFRVALALDAPTLAFAVTPFQEAVEDLQERVAVTRPDREAGVVVVGYRGNDPELVQRVPNALVAAFLARRQQAQSAEAHGTVAFLDEQIGGLDRQLADAEETLRSFREQNRIVSVEAEADAQVERLAGLQARRDLLVAERVALGRLLEEVRSEVPPAEGPSPYRKLMSFPTLITNTAVAEMLAQVVTLENQRAEFLMTRTTSDRDVLILDERIAALETQLRMMAETYWRGLGEQVRSLGQGLAGFETELARIPAQQMTYVRMGREAGLLAELYTLLQTKQKEAQIAAAVQDQAVRVVDPALYPTKPIRPRPWLSVLCALALGLALGVGGAVAAEHMDRTVRDRSDLQAATGGAAVLGLIPTISADEKVRRLPIPWVRRAPREAARPRLVHSAVAGDPAAESYRLLRTNINFARPSAPPRTLVFTSPMPGDGKSTTAANMALVLARQQGGRILLVDADMRRGALNTVFGEPGEPGLSNVLAGQVQLADAVCSISLSEGCRLDFLAAGTRPPNPAELLSSEAMTELLRDTGGRYDTVVMDAPPLNLVTDGALLGARADGVVLVVRAGITEEEPLAHAIEQIERVHASLLGTVLNGVDERRPGYYGNAAHGYFDPA